MQIILRAAILLGFVLGAAPAWADREFISLRAVWAEQSRPAEAQREAQKPRQQSRKVVTQGKKTVQAAPARKQRKSAGATGTARKKAEHKLDERFLPQSVPFEGYKPGTIVIDTKSKFLYLVENEGTARRYGVAVGTEGLQFKGEATIRVKQKWPRWVPTQNMIKRAPQKYARYRNGMEGGPNNPLGARALYLYRGGVDTHIRIHGTNQPWTIGQAASNGCFRMVNDHVIDLFDRVPIGTPVVVM